MIAVPQSSVHHHLGAGVPAGLGHDFFLSHGWETTVAGYSNPGSALIVMGFIAVPQLPNLGSTALTSGPLFCASSYYLCRRFPTPSAQWVLRGSGMETCCIHTEAKDRNRTRSQIYLSDICPVRTPAKIPPATPTFSSQPHDNKDVKPIKRNLTHRNKGLACSSFRVFSKTKDLQRDQGDCIRKPQPSKWARPSRTGNPALA
jgi:hypothetical protein